MELKPGDYIISKISYERISSGRIISVNEDSCYLVWDGGSGTKQFCYITNLLMWCELDRKRMRTEKLRKILK